MSLGDALRGATLVHKRVARQLVDASEKSITLYCPAEPESVPSGAAMFADLENSGSYTPYGPFSCTWIDADVARTAGSGPEFAMIRTFGTTEIVLKLFLEDVLVSSDEPYGATRFDTAEYAISDDGKRYEILGYDRFGLGVSSPYLVAVAIRGSYSAE